MFNAISIHGYYYITYEREIVAQAKNYNSAFVLVDYANATMQDIASADPNVNAAEHIVLH